MPHSPAGMTIGMLIAFISRTSASLSSRRAPGRAAIEYRTLDLHLERLADIAGA
jgi:hypothetical protein